EDLIPYPREDTLKQLTALKEPGEGVVLSDRPEKIYYVATLLKRAEPMEEEFHRIYAKTPRNDKLLDGLERDCRRQYREAAIKQLRAEAGPIDQYGHFKFDIDEDVRRAVDNRKFGSSEE